ncbi:MAG: HupE/UreJ family protein [Verrucomicrobiae bacterium]|nr:HupE/UreJ family protein [Verrucomicrobiae bacterium]
MKISSRNASRLRQSLFLLAIVLLPSLAQAHPGHTSSASGAAAGLLHPFSGLDHLCAMIAVGLWAAQRGGRALWLVPLTFVSVMALGGILGMNGIQVPLAEQGVAASVLILGLLLAAAARLPLAASVVTVGIFAIFHGYAHGAEMPATAAGLSYGLGFLAATAALHLVGIGLGLLAQQLGSTRLIRCAGVLIALFSLYLFCNN